MSSCCPICYRATGERIPDCSRSAAESMKEGEGEGDGEEFQEVKVQQKFLRLLEIYLSKGEVEVDNDGGIGGNSGQGIKVKPFSDKEDNHHGTIGSFQLGQLIGRGRGLLSSCGECLELMEGFCRNYHQLRTIELELNWKVERLRNLMKGAGRIPSRVNYMREVVGRGKYVEGKGPRRRRVDDVIGTVIKSKKALIEKCSRKLRNTFPKLPITKWQPDAEGRTSSLAGVLPSPQRGNANIGHISGTETVTLTIGEEFEVGGSSILQSPSVMEGDVGHLQAAGNMDHPVPPQISCAGGPPISLECQSLDETLSYSPTDHLQQHETPAEGENEKTAGKKRNLDESDYGTEDVPVSKSKQIRCDDEVDDNRSSGMDHEPVDFELDNDKDVPEDPESLPVSVSAAEIMHEREREANGVAPPKAFQKIELSDHYLKTDTEPHVECPPELECATTPEPTPSMTVITCPEIPSPEKNLSRLRSSHRCSHCGRTFSSDERLQVHIREDHKDGESVEDAVSSDNEHEDADGDAHEGDSEYAGDDDDHGKDGDSMFWTSSSSEDEYEIKFESRSHKIGSEEERDPLELQEDGNYKSTGKKAPSKDSHGRTPAPSNLLSFKCPDCSNLFGSIKTLLKHRKNSTSCKHLYDSSASIKVHVFNQPEGDPSNPSDPSAPKLKAASVFAVIDLPQEFYICEEKKCGGAIFYNSDDFEDHQKLHGSFRCKFCKVKKSYAPNLALHEHLRHAPFIENTRKGDRSKVYNCPRCDFESWGCNGPKMFIRHHLKHHLNLVFYEPVCAICQHKALLPKRQLKDHLKTHHDLTNVAPEDVKRCPTKNCKAYFLTASYLKAHQSRCCQSANRIGTGIRLKCPDCSHLFSSINEFLVHRRDSMSCGESYDPATSVRVEIFIVPPTSQNGLKIEGGATNNSSKQAKTKFSHRIAIIDLPQGIFTCDICQTIVYSSEDLEAHKKLHGSFPCSSCDEELTFAPNLAIHDLKHKRRRDKEKHSKLDSDIRCPRCDFKCACVGRQSYVRHYVEQHLSLTLNEPTCSICNVEPKGKSVDLAEHFQKFHDLTHASTPEGVKKCTVANCQAYFLTAIQLHHHLRMRHNLDLNAKKYKCKDCVKSYAHPQALRAHRLKYHVGNVEPIPCVFENCPKVFESKDDMHRHIVAPRMHKALDDPSKMVPCPKCEAFFAGSEPSLLIQHLKSKHNDDIIAIHVCELCGKSFKNKYFLARHALTHSGPDSWEFTCSVCSKKCMTKSKLEEHMRTHTNERRFVCDVCGDKFAQPVHLRAHAQRKHAGSEGNKLQGENTGTSRRKSTGRKNKLAPPPSRTKKSTKKKASEDEDDFGEEDVYSDDN